MKDSIASRMRALAQVVADNFASAPLTSSERNPPRIARTDLPWACPPLRTHTKLNGVPLTEYLTPDCAVDADALYAFWTLNLKQLWDVPVNCLKGGLFVGLQKVLPGARKGTCATAFSLPLGWPGQIDESAGLTFSLEAAHLAIHCVRDLQAVYDDDDSYAAQLADGRVIGVLNGVPAASAYWKHYSQRGVITDLTETFRGQSLVECQYDQLAALRSVLWENDKAFPQFEAMDIAMQALRVMSFGTRCPNLSAGGREQAGRVEQLREREIALYDAIDVMHASMVDRRKLECLWQILVPVVMSKTRFRRDLFAGDEFPYTLRQGAADSILETLTAMYEQEIPCNLRRSLP